MKGVLLTLMLNFLLFEFFSSLILVYVAKKEYDFILFNVNKECSLSTKISNADLIYASIVTIFKDKFGELKAFLYPIALNIIALATYWQIKALFGEHEVSKWIIVYLGVVCFIVTLHIVIPYYFTYLKYYEGSINRKMDFIKFLDFSTNAFYKSDTIEEIKWEDQGKLKNFKELINRYFTSEELSKYNDILSFLDPTKYRALTKEEFDRVLPHLNGHNIYFKEIETDKFCEFWISSESDVIEVYRLISGSTQMGMALFSKTTIGSLLNQRYLDIVAFFLFLHIVLYFAY